MNSELHDIVANSLELAESTRERYLRDLNSWIEFAGEHPSGWTRKRAQDFYLHLLHERKLKPQSANRFMQSIIYASQWRAKRENDPSLDFAVLQMKSDEDPALRSALTQEQATKLLETCLPKTPIDLRDFALIVIGLETGMRRMSLIDLNLESIIMAPYPHSLVRAKGKSKLSVPISDTTIKALDPWRAWMLGRRGIRKGPVFRALTKRKDGDIFVYTPGHRPISAQAIQDILTKRSKQAGINHVHPHMFRHTFVTWRFSAGLSPHEVAAITGHTLSGLGAMAGYMDMAAIGQRARASTPEWLAELVERFHGG
jgi:site-specific recombinase XerD